MPLDEEIYHSLYADVAVCLNYMKQIAAGMVRGGVSQYPIFVALRGEMDIDLGLPIINRADWDISWSFNASHLEDFVHRGVVHQDKVDVFLKAYKNVNEYLCVFVADEEASSFVFIPYTNDKSHLN